MSTIVSAAVGGCCPTVRPGPVPARVSAEAAQSRFKLNETIVIPQEAAARDLSSFSLSTRLAHVLRCTGHQLLGELDGLSYREFSLYRNCGRKTVEELRLLVRDVQLGTEPDKPAVNEPKEAAPRGWDYVWIPSYARELGVCDLPISTRLANVLESKGIVRLGDLHGLYLAEFEGVSSLGERTLGELVDLIRRVIAGEFRLTGGAYSIASVGSLPPLIDDCLAKLPAHWREILQLRFCGDVQRTWTLAEIGEKFGLTRERVRQIVEAALAGLRRIGSARLNEHLRGLASVCCAGVAPLTPALLAKWLGQSPARTRFAPVAYVRFVAELSPHVPVWLLGYRETLGSRTARHAEISTVLHGALREGQPGMPLADALAQVAERFGGKKPSVLEFLEALKRAHALVVDFSIPDQPTLRLRRLTSSDVTKAVLSASPGPLTAEEILAKGREKFGDEAVTWSTESIVRRFPPPKGIYLLGPGRYGLRRHFQLPDTMARAVRADVHRVLQRKKRPTSTGEMLAAYGFEWAQRINQYELACLLREDERFADLGRLLFGLKTWSILKRPYIEDLITKVMAKHGRPMTCRQLLAHLCRLRSVSPRSLARALWHHPMVRRYGSHSYGLKSWRAEASRRQS